MRPRRASPRRSFPTTQLSLPLETTQLVALDAMRRPHVVAVLARLLLEAGRPGRRSEGGDDAA